MSNSACTKFKVEVLDNSALIDDACALLYDVYIEQGGWQFADDNPSELKIVEKNGRKLLVDRFISTSRWFGIFDDEKLISCARLQGLDQNRKYEIEEYSSSEKVWSTFGNLPRDSCVEMGKVAVSAEYKGRRIINLIYLSMFEYCERNRYSVFGCLCHQYIKALFNKVGLNPRIDQAFKYEETDPMPVSFYFVDYEAGDYKKIIANLRKTLTDDKDNKKCSVIEALEIIVPLLPVPAYWMGADGRVLGINDLCLKGMGAEREKIIGHTPKDFYPSHIADRILSHNDLVMRTEQIISQDETINNLSTGEVVHAKALKVPLYDNERVIGIIGTSVDLTAEKQAEQLKIENARQQAALDEKEKFVLLGRKFAHDIASPLMTMKILTENFKNLEEQQDNNLGMFKKVLEKFLSTTESLLATYRKAEISQTIIDDEPKTKVFVCEELKQLIEEKKIQFSNEKVRFTFEDRTGGLNPAANLQISQFMRAISNMINNAVDATLAQNTVDHVHVELQASEKFLYIKIQDSGIGMKDEVKEKILSGNRVTEGKAKGNGMGMQQVWDFLNQNSGTMEIGSNLSGTSISIIFPRGDGNEN